MVPPKWNEDCMLKSPSSRVLVGIENAQDLEPRVKFSYRLPVVVLTGTNNEEVTNKLSTSFYYSCKKENNY
jgi:hypothetical protein